VTSAGLLRWVKIPLPGPGSEVVEWDGSQTASLGALRGFVSRKMLLDTLTRICGLLLTIWETRQLFSWMTWPILAR